MNFQDHNIFSNNLYDNLFYLRKKQLKENTATASSGQMSNKEIERRQNALNVVMKSRENEGFFTSAARAFGMNPRPESEEVGTAQAVLNSPEGSLPQGKLEREQGPVAPAPSLGQQTPQLNTSRPAGASPGLNLTAPKPAPTSFREASPVGGSKGAGVPVAQQPKSLSFTDPDTGKQIGGQNNQPLELESGGGLSLPKIKSDSSYYNKLSSTIQSGNINNQGMNYKPGFSSEQNNQPQQMTTAEKNAEIAERNRKRSGMQADQMLSKGMNLAQQSGINPMGQIGSAGGLSPNTMPLQNRNVGYTNQANVSGFRASRGFV
jgi:hypothetical protein